MRSGYSLVWTERAQHDLYNIINYLKANWTQRELQRFSRKLDQRIQLLISNPLLVPASEKKKKVRRSVLSKHTIIYYSIGKNQIRILSLFNPNQDPKKSGF